MIELAFGCFVLVALGLAFREAAQSHQDNGFLVHESIESTKSLVDISVYEPELVVQEAIEQLIQLNAQLITNTSYYDKNIEQVNLTSDSTLNEAEA